MAEREFVANVENLQDVLDFTSDELEKRDCSMKIIVRMNVCIEEMFANVAHYAYNGDDGPVIIAVDGDGEKVTVSLTDWGIPFDPLAKADPDVTLSAEQRKIGGLGIYMVKKSMDEVFYERNENKNIFKMTKYI